jgi:hypothetical protein
MRGAIAHAGASWPAAAVRNGAKNRKAADTMVNRRQLGTDEAFWRSLDLGEIPVTWEYVAGGRVVARVRHDGTAYVDTLNDVREVGFDEAKRGAISAAVKAGKVPDLLVPDWLRKKKGKANEQD